ncbi:aminotransferase class I/II-fold pyridoxal phosphate-dependent enzyme, partial [Mycobacterium sp.]|uniref:aminotransferase class I/II-fold pyridoxal phosphate-dependent enzyme n=1 Tax=Mycobacterium sp. TaxID=1785 RepID=UPI003C77399E
MSVSGTTLGPELLVQLDRGRSEPLHRQLAEALRGAIRAGRIMPGSRVPSTRVLAADLGVSRRLVVDTYDQLAAEGFLVSKRGSGTLVARVDTTTGAPSAQGVASPHYDVDFAPGAPDLAGFPRDSWLRALRQGLSQASSDMFGYVEPQGIASVRAALSEYLGRTRGVVADPTRIVMCSGVTQGVGLIAQLLRRRGAVPLAMEDPGFWVHRIVLQHHEIKPITVA